MDKNWLYRHRRAAVAALVVVVGLGFSILALVTLNVPGDFWKKIGYPGIFLLSLIGASSIIIPIPYTVVLLAISPAFDLILLTIAAGAGSALGELVGYGLGYLGRDMLDEKRRGQMNAMLKIFRKYGVFAVFLFAFTPLPDDMLFIPLGLMRYSLWKTFAACIAGKFAMIFSIGIIGKTVGGLFGDWPFAVLMTIFLVLIIVAVFKIDWVKLAGRYAPKESQRSPG
ncbi:MAG: VTT domain-containing protein [Methanobacteriota archaeon]